MNEGEKAANTWYDLRQRCKANYEGFSSVHLAVASLLVPRVDSQERRIFQCVCGFFSLKKSHLVARLGFEPVIIQSAHNILATGLQSFSVNCWSKSQELKTNISSFFERSSTLLHKIRKLPLLDTV